MNTDLIELKRSYYECAARFLAELEFEQMQPSLFDLLETT